jgi:hypothetical protein
VQIAAEEVAFANVVGRVAMGEGVGLVPAGDLSHPSTAVAVVPLDGGFQLPVRLIARRGAVNAAAQALLDRLCADDQPRVAMHRPVCACGIEVALISAGRALRAMCGYRQDGFQLRVGGELECLAPPGQQLPLLPDPGDHVSTRSPSAWTPRPGPRSRSSPMPSSGEGMICACCTNPARNDGLRVQRGQLGTVLRGQIHWHSQ